MCVSLDGDVVREQVGSVWISLILTFFVSVRFLTCLWEFFRMDWWRLTISSSISNWPHIHLLFSSVSKIERKHARHGVTDREESWACCKGSFRFFSKVEFSLFPSSLERSTKGWNFHMEYFKTIESWGINLLFSFWKEGVNNSWTTLVNVVKLFSAGVVDDALIVCFDGLIDWLCITASSKKIVKISSTIVTKAPQLYITWNGNVLCTVGVLISWQSRD